MFVRDALGLSLRDSSGENSVQQQQLKVLCNSFFFFFLFQSLLLSLSHSFMLAGTAVAAFQIIQNEPEEGKKGERARETWHRL